MTATAIMVGVGGDGVGVLGRANQRMEEAEESLFLSSGDEICASHVREAWLRARVAPTTSNGPCVACGSASGDHVGLDSLLDLLAETIRCHWRRTIDDLFLDDESPSGFALIEHPLSTEDLVRDEMYKDLDEDLMEVAVSRLLDEQWYDRGAIWLEGRVLLAFSWKEFVEHVKRTRRLNYMIEPSDGMEADESATGIDPERMLSRLRDLVDDLGLIDESDASWYRSVHVPKGTKPVASRVGTAPTGIAPVNRMSPKGVSMFYGAAEQATSCAEVGRPPDGEVTFTGRWIPTRPLRVLDLASQREPPSFHDCERAQQRQALLFLQEFAMQVSLPASDESVYLPTQALAAFMRDNLDGLDGVVYRSSRVPGRCCALFVPNDRCLDSPPATEKIDVALVLD